MLSSIFRTLRCVLVSATFAAAQLCWAQQTYTISIVAGGGYTTPGNGGPATSAQLYEPIGVAEDANGNIYFAEHGRQVIRKVTPDGDISTIAGQYNSGGFSGDGGLAANAKLSSPYGIALDSFGNLYIADTANNRVRKISTDDIITTVAGGGTPPCCGIIGDGGPATAAVLLNPWGVAIDSSGNLYIADTENRRVRKVDTKGIITTVAGGGTGPGIGDGGPATKAQLGPLSVALDLAGNLYIVDHLSDRIRKVATNGIISTFAGTGTNGYTGDGGPATSADLFVPWGVAVDAFGNVYITDYGNHVVRAVNTKGIINTIAGGGPCCTFHDGEPAIGADLTYPEGISVGAGGKLYFSSGGWVFLLTPGPLTDTSTSLASDGNPQDLGKKVTFAALVQPMSGSGTPTGSVIFKIDGASAATIPLDNSGHASYATSSLTAGPHTITAAYSGDATYSTSSASLIETIVMPVSVTFGTVPAGLAYAVDGATYVSSQIVSLYGGSKHTISVISPQTASGTQNAFVNWSDGGAQTHVITIPSVAAPASYIANFKTSYLLTTVANPVTGGSVSPASGTYYPAGTAVALTATPKGGYAFSGWTGNVVSATSASTTIKMTAPQTATASFGPSGATSLSGNITAKTGPSSARIWSIQINNSGPSSGVATRISGIVFTQVGGAACAPVIGSALPVAAGNLAPGSSVTVPLTVDFSLCAANARFTVTIALSANSGSASGSVVRLNQFE